MSSILKALKKIEDKSLPRDGGQSLLEKIDTKRAINQRARGRWIFKKILLGSTLLLVVAGSAWFLLLNRSHVAEIFSPRPMPQKDTREGLRTSALSPPIQKPNPEILSSPAAIRPESERPTVSQQETTVTTTNIEAVKRVTPDPQAPKVQQEKVAPTGMDESRFKLEAIVWSSNPDSRFAVIDGRIVRSGGIVDDITITHIDRDYVAFRSSGGEGKLRFRVE